MSLVRGVDHDEWRSKIARSLVTPCRDAATWAWA
jgi:hypothetical protein